MSLLHPLSPSSPHSGLPGINIASYNSPLTKSMSNTPLSSAKSSYSIASDFFVSPPTQGSREKRKGNLLDLDFDTDPTSKKLASISRSFLNNEATKTNYKTLSRQISNSKLIQQAGKAIELTESISSGNYSEIKYLSAGQPTLYPNVLNESIVIKLVKPEIPDISDLLINSKNQYECLVKDFADKSDEEKPYVKIYNLETFKTDGFFALEKVIPFNDCPWIKGALLEDLDPNQKQILDQVKALFQYTYLNEEEIGLDLWWPNLGIRPGTETVVIFDYKEQDDIFFTFIKDRIRKISNESRSIEKYLLEGLEDKVIAKQSDLQQAFNEFLEYFNKVN